MTIQDVERYHNETVVAIAHLKDMGYEVPPEALEIKGLAEFAIEQYKMLQEKEKVICSLEDRLDSIWEQNMGEDL